MNKNNIIEIIKKLDTTYPDIKGSLNFSSPFQLTIAVILSAQCTDERVNKTTKEVFLKYSNPNDFNKISLEEIMELFKNINFYRNKSRNIKKLCKILVEKYDGIIPENVEELMELPGIGRKSANVILNDAFNNPVGIAVDTHVKRLATRLQFSKEVQPIKIEQDLLKIIPKQYWYRVNHLFVHYGRNVCTAQKPICNECIIKKYCKK